MAKDKKALSKLIGTLQNAISEGCLNKQAVTSATRELSEINKKYTYKQKYPELPSNTDSFIDESGDKPSNLAEVLLWKQGDWLKYKNFSENYKKEEPTLKNGVVFGAFARHLKDRSNPIYDQHALRALWAICGKFTDDEKSCCKAGLFMKKNDKGSENNEVVFVWKDSIYGKKEVECYELFVCHMRDLVSKDGSATLEEIDRLLMPLGQAIKESTHIYSELCSLCGWNSNG